MILTFIFLGVHCFATPAPGTGSSAFGQQYREQVLSPYGFKFKHNPQIWNITTNLEAKNMTNYKLEAQDSAFKGAQFSVNFDQLSKPTTLDNYVKKWIKEYHFFGFEILSNKPLKIAGTDSVVVDLVHRQKQKQIRQLVVFNKKSAVTMTCVDDVQRFAKTVTKCHEIMKSFEWTRP